MTCIVGLVDDGHVWMGADSASTDGWMVRECVIPKTFRLGEVLIGYSSSFRMGQVLECHLELPVACDTTVPRLYVAGPLVEAIRSTLHRYHWATEEHNKQEGCALLVGYRGHLFCIGDEYQVTEEADGYDAIGCGAKFALGAMYASSEIPAAERIMVGLKAAAHLSGGVMPPFHVASLAPGGEVEFLP